MVVEASLREGKPRPPHRSSLRKEKTMPLFTYLRVSYRVPDGNARGTGVDNSNLLKKLSPMVPIVYGECLCYTPIYMSTTKKREIATIRVRLFPSTYKRLKIRALKEGRSFAILVDELDKQHGKSKTA